MARGTPPMATAEYPGQSGVSGMPCAQYLGCGRRGGGNKKHRTQPYETAGIDASVMLAIRMFILDGAIWGAVVRYRARFVVRVSRQRCQGSSGALGRPNGTDDGQRAPARDVDRWPATVRPSNGSGPQWAAALAVTAVSSSPEGADLKSTTGRPGRQSVRQGSQDGEDCAPPSRRLPHTYRPQLHP